MTVKPIERVTDSSNVDQAEIRKFENMASKWWDKNGDFKPLHDINPLRANYIDTASEVAEKKVLDIGCGGGLLAEALAHRGAVVTGIDMGEAPLEVAKLHCLESQLDIRYEKTTAEELAQKTPEQYDIVTCLEMLEHVPEPSSVVKACADLAKPGAHIYFSTINRNLKSYIFAILGAEYVLKLLPKGTHEYKKFIQPAELSRWARESGLIIEDICGMVYNPITKNYKLHGSDVSVNYIIRTHKPS